MFSKNIKILSLFLILAVVMIGALGAVSASAPTAADDGSVNSTINSATTNSVNATTTDGATGSISGTIVTTTDSNHSEIPSGSVVNNAGNTPTINQPDTGIYTYNGTNYNKLNTGTATIGAITFNSTAGTFTTPVTLAGNLNNLKSGSTYYVAINLPTSDLYTVSSDGNYYATVNATNPYFVSFLYNAPQIILDNNATTVTFGNNS